MVPRKISTVTAGPNQCRPTRRGALPKNEPPGVSPFAAGSSEQTRLRFRPDYAVLSSSVATRLPRDGAGAAGLARLSFIPTRGAAPKGCAAARCRQIVRPAHRPCFNCRFLGRARFVLTSNAPARTAVRERCRRTQGAASTLGVPPSPLQAPARPVPVRVPAIRARPMSSINHTRCAASGTKNRRESGTSSGQHAAVGYRQRSLRVFCRNADRGRNRRSEIALCQSRNMNRWLSQQQPST